MKSPKVCIGLARRSLIFALMSTLYIDMHMMLYASGRHCIAPSKDIEPIRQWFIYSGPQDQCLALLAPHANQLQWHSCKDAAYLFKLIDTPLQSISNTVSSKSVESLSMSLASVTDRCFSGMTSSIPSASNESLFKRSDRPSTCSNHCVAYRTVAWSERPGYTWSEKPGLRLTIFMNCD